MMVHYFFVVSGTVFCIFLHILLMNFEYGEDCEGQQGWGYMTRESVKSVKGVMITVQDSEEGV